MYYEIVIMYFLFHGEMESDLKCRQWSYFYYDSLVALIICFNDGTK